MSSWSNVYLIAGLRLEIASDVGDPTTYLPCAMHDFTARGPGEAEMLISLLADEAAQADPLKRFFPTQFIMESCPEGLSFDGKDGRRKRLGYISTGCARAELGLPHLDGPWRMPEEEEAVRETFQSFVRGCLQCRLLQEGDTFMHAAGIAWEGDGFAFTGHTRSGKTTLSRDFPVEAVLGDDLVAVRRAQGGFTLFGTPWPGREKGVVAYGGVPLRAVFSLHPDTKASCCRQSPAEALTELIANAPRTGHAGEEGRLLEVFSSLAEAVPIYRLSLRLGDDVVPYMLQASSKECGRDR